METATQALGGLLTRLTDEIYVHVPCQVTAVHGNTVDAIAYINDDEDDFVLYNIPIKRQETQNAYIFLGIKKGDYGTLIFYDRSIDDYRNGETYYNGDDRQHDLNDRAFELGFIPNPSAFIYPTNQEIEIGLKDGKAKISINANGDINIISNSIAITTPTTIINSNVNITGNLDVTGTCTFESKPFMTHTHLSSTPNTPTGGVV